MGIASDDRPAVVVIVLVLVLVVVAIAAGLLPIILQLILSEGISSNY